MARAKNSSVTRARHKKWIKMAKGFRGRRKKVFKLAKEAVLKAGQHAYFDRRKKKGVTRQLWQIQINAAAREHGLSYSRLIYGLRKNNIEIDKKVLADLARRQPESFKAIVEHVQKAQQ